MGIPQSEDGDFIEGIYHYCDRWCERCPMTTRCRQYAMECTQDAFNADGSGDGNTSEFIEGLLGITSENKLNPADTEEPAYEEFSSSSFEEDNEEDNEFDTAQYIADCESIDRETQAIPCVKLADHYMSEASRWLDEWEILLDQLDQSEAVLAEATEIISWYVFQIPTKVRRSINGNLRDDPNLEEDINGSAKVALIGCDKSLEAWENIKNCLPAENQDAATPLLQLLRELICEIEGELPKARNFKRPGFDD